MVLFDNSSYFFCKEFQQNYTGIPWAVQIFFIFEGKIRLKLGISVIRKLLMINGEIDKPNVYKVNHFTLTFLRLKETHALLVMHGFQVL